MFIRDVRFISLFLKGPVAGWPAGLPVMLGCYSVVLFSGCGCEVWFLPPASPRLAVNSAHFEIRRLGYSSLEMLPAVLLLSERSQIKTSLEGISE